MEEVVAIVECNNCFTDGIQVVTGCTFGNNALIYKDLGKTAVTVARRQNGAAVRLVVHPDFRQRLFGRYPAAGPLFEKVVMQRQGTAEDQHRFHHLWEAVARRELEEVDLSEQFLIETCTIQMPALCPDFGHGDVQPLRRGGDGVPHPGPGRPEGLSGLRRGGVLCPYRPGDRLQPGNLRPEPPLPPAEIPASGLFVRKLV